MKKVYTYILAVVMLLSFVMQPVYAADYRGHWAEDEINRWFESGVIKGDENGDFMPDKSITRAEFTSLVMRSIKADIVLVPSKFEDIVLSEWYYKDIATAESMGIVTGSDMTHFMPNAYITRQDAAVIISRAYNIKKSAVFNISEYTDGLEIASYAISAMAFMCENGILTGYADNTIRPGNDITRAEALVILDRMNSYMSNPMISGELKFENGYPRLRSTGLTDGFNLSVKTNKPCTVYYTLGETGTALRDKEQIDSLLTVITKTDAERNVYIPADTDKSYNIYLKAVDAYGNESKTKVIYNAKTIYYTEGEGTRENPYMISTEEQLDAVRYYPDKSFRLKNDISISGMWTPICGGATQDNMFSGTFDGNGYKISGLGVGGMGDNAGLFGYIYSGEVRNLYVSADKVMGNNNVGIIAGTLNGGTVEECFTDGLVKAGGSYAGAIVGRNNGTVRRCQSAVFAVEAVSFAGGISGWNAGIIEECMSCTYSVRANMYSSGISGMNSGGTIKNCLAANMHITDYMTENNGRITTNKENGKLINNYAYDMMTADVGDWLPGADSPNGLDVDWDSMSKKSFYTSSANWRFDNSWKIASEEESFRLPYLKKLSPPKIQEGVTAYAPERIYSPEDMEKIRLAPDNHYILMKDIFYGAEDGSREPICGENEVIDEPEKGFSGSFDGNGHFVYNMKQEYEEDRRLYGIFGVIAGGTVKNLNIVSADISGAEITGIIAAVNYGNIINCTVSGKISSVQTENAVMTGGIVGDNYGTIRDCDSDVSIVSRGNSVTAGGICADNEGMLTGCSAKGKINSTGRSSASSCTVGGISGFCGEGKIYETYSGVKINAGAQYAYIGGICGMLSGGEIYKAAANVSSAAKVNSSLSSAAYIGGITGLSNNSIVVHSFSSGETEVDGTSVYAGGISGYNLGGHIRGCYTTLTINHKFIEKAYTGGISGINENGFITENAALNPSMSEGGEVGRICAASQDGVVSENYAYKGVYCGSVKFEDSDLNGTGLSLKEMTDRELYFKPMERDGKLGWQEDIWRYGNGINPYYRLPTLLGVKNQDKFIMPY